MKYCHWMLGASIRCAKVYRGAIHNKIRIYGYGYAELYITFNIFFIFNNVAWHLFLKKIILASL